LEIRKNIKEAFMSLIPVSRYILSSKALVSPRLNAGQDWQATKWLNMNNPWRSQGYG
jgi:hypothetical protein